MSPRTIFSSRRVPTSANGRIGAFASSPPRSFAVSLRIEPRPGSAPRSRSTFAGSGFAASSYRNSFGSCDVLTAGDGARRLRPRSSAAGEHEADHEHADDQRHADHAVTVALRDDARHESQDPNAAWDL